MAMPTSTLATYEAKGIREDLADTIYMVDPYDTPFLTSIPHVNATSTLHEWQSQALAAASASNAVIEGDDATVDAATVTVRLTNYCQISDKVASVTGTMQAVNKAGRDDELAYQLYLKGLELRRDMETILWTNQIKAAGNDTTARKLGGVPTWITSNDSRGTNGVEGGLGATLATDGTARAFTETLLQDVLKLCWDNGGDPDKVYVGSFNKRVMSAFAGNATRMANSDDDTLHTAIKIYSSDWGDLEIVPDRFGRAGSAYCIESDMWAVAFLRNMTRNPLAKTGDSDKEQILCEYTLECRNEKSSGVVADLTSS